MQGQISIFAISGERPIARTLAIVLGYDKGIWGWDLLFRFAENVVRAVDVYLPGGELRMGGDELRELVDLVPTPLVTPYLRPELDRGDRSDVEFSGAPFRVFDEGGDEGEGEAAVFHDHEVVAVPDVLGDHVQIVIIFIDVSVEAFFTSAAGFRVRHRVIPLVWEKYNRRRGIGNGGLP
jgi:hypothetical protein